MTALRFEPTTVRGRAFEGIAVSILGRALAEKGQTDDQLVGVLYLLGRSNEALGKSDAALAFLVPRPHREDRPPSGHPQNRRGKTGGGP